MSLPPNPLPKQRTPVWAWFMIGCGGLIFLVVLLAATIVFPTLAKTQDKMRQGACFDNMGRLMRGMYMYAEDNDERFPLANSWQTGITPYMTKADTLSNGVKLPSAFLCLSTKAAQTSYAFNAALSSRSMSNAVSEPRVVMLFESDKDVANAAGGKESLVSQPRHGGANHFAFATGDIKAISANDTQNFTPKSGGRR